MKKFLSVLMSVLMILTCFGAVAFAADSTASVMLRIEGITENLYNSKVSVKDGATVLDLIKAADEKSESLTVKTVDSYYGPYVSEINGEKEKTFGGFDGWNFLLNGESPDFGVSACKVSDGDSVVFYYGDTYMLGMQYPKLDASDLKNGVIAFTSVDTTYDPVTWEPIKAENPVTDMTVTWSCGSKTKQYTTDSNGKVTVEKDMLKDGFHMVSVERKAANGCPTVLRLEPNTTVETGTHALNVIRAFFAKIISAFKNAIEAVKKLFGNVGK